MKKHLNAGLDITLQTQLFVDASAFARNLV